MDTSEYHTVWFKEQKCMPVHTCWAAGRPCWGSVRSWPLQCDGSRSAGRLLSSFRWASLPASPVRSGPSEGAGGPRGWPACSSACPGEKAWNTQSFGTNLSFLKCFIHGIKKKTKNTVITLSHYLIYIYSLLVSIFLHFRSTIPQRRWDFNDRIIWGANDSIMEVKLHMFKLKLQVLSNILSKFTARDKGKANTPGQDWKRSEVSISPHSVSHASLWDEHLETQESWFTCMVLPLLVGVHATLMVSVSVEQFAGHSIYCTWRSRMNWGNLWIGFIIRPYRVILSLLVSWRCCKKRRRKRRRCVVSE